ncbi:hypothetical protein PENTCL1PPCAC_16558, partial [Pristionchus entomophagus]
LCLALLGFAEARVTFTSSEVLQASDLVNTRANFKCVNGCKVYTDSKSASLFIMEYNEQTKFESEVVKFQDMGGLIGALPEPYNLKPSKNYFIENRAEADPTFVFYAVDNNAPNFDTQVMIIDDDWGIDGDGATRMFTILSSKFDSVRYNQFDGAFQEGYPRIYSVGFDAVAEMGCQPLYQSRSQESATMAAITVFSPISTVDYGREGKHNMHVKWNKDATITQNAKSSTVYSSPGYVGCRYNSDQSYSSSKTSLQDTFTLKATSLDVNAVFHLQTADDALHLKINDDKLDFFGSPSYTKHYNTDSYDVDIKWTRKSANANFALQLDFGLGKTDDTKTTAKVDESTTSS